MEFRQLIPKSGDVDVAYLLSQLNFEGHAGDDRPYTVVNLISSADGRASFHGRSAPLGNDGDRELFHGLREQVDAIFVGTTTLRTESYGALVRDPERRERRVQGGLAPEPLACVVSRSGDVPVEIPLFSEPGSRIVVFSPAELDTSSCAAQVELVRLDPAELTLTTVLGRLRSQYETRSLLCEGGPTVFGALLREHLVDELFLTLGPTLVGGGFAPTITNGPELDELARLELVWALERESALYLRYAVG